MTNRRTYHQLSQLEIKSAASVVWLASWYPSVTEPSNGDFIQRHAEAVSAIMPLTVIHTIHDSSSDQKIRFEVSESGMLTEIRIYFQHDGDVKGIFSRLNYNRLFYKYTGELLEHMISRHGKPSALHVHVPMKMGRIALWAKKKWGIPYLVSEHSSAYLPGVSDSYENRSFYYRYFVKKIFQQALFVTNVSRALGDIIGKIAGRDDIKVIRNVADTSRFFYQQVEHPVFAFIHVSTLKVQKNVKGMLSAFERLYGLRQDFHLDMVGGDGEILHEIRATYGEAPWLTLSGTVDYDQVPGYMQRANCLVLFSRDENFPCVIVEGLCCGLPVITSDAGGAAEAIHVKNGLVVPQGDEEALLSALLTVLNGYQNYNPRQIASEAASKYSYGKIGSDFANLYRNAGIS